ncbi:MAG: hypothetical protein N2260_10760 [Syntrophobacterales bacterium]|nr:hypothetical protein [Syntrophobacterales bacterium]
MYEAYIAHQTRNRLRIRLKRGHIPEKLVPTIMETLSLIPGVELVKVNPVTGSILLQGSTLEPKKVMEILTNSLSIRFEASSPIHPVQRAIQPFIHLDKTLRDITGGEVGLTEAGFLALLSIGAIQVLRGNITAPPWYTAFWYAFGVFSKALIEKYAPGKSSKEIEQPEAVKPTSENNLKESMLTRQEEFFEKEDEIL